MRALLWLTALLIIVGAGAAAALHFFSSYLERPGPLPQERIVFISPGTGVRAMAEQLRLEGVIAEPYAFLAAVQVTGVAPKLKAGEYEMGAGISLRAVVDKIASGAVYRRQVTIPEGLWSSEVRTLLNGADAMRGTVTDMPAEGSILPETYAYIRNDDRNAILAQAQKAMRETVDALWEGRAGDLPFSTKEEAVVLASIVEKETGVAPERARIAGVFVNRLRLGMMLQSDPTVIYAITGGESKIDRVLYAHLDADSAYNTYRHTGLPPGPICNPGRAAIAAVLRPEAHDFLYFVADGTGGHAFARTLDEHNANVAKWRAIQRQSRGQSRGQQQGQ